MEELSNYFSLIWENLLRFCAIILAALTVLVIPLYELTYMDDTIIINVVNEIEVCMKNNTFYSF